MFKSDAAPTFPAGDSHVVMFCNGSDSEYTVRQVASQLLPGTRLTVLSVPSHCAQVLQGTTIQQSHGDLLLSAYVLSTLGIPPSFESSAQFSSITGLQLYQLSVHTRLLSVREKPLPAPVFDSLFS
eukprot:jgi/Botrbrau1/22488/Bobra.114_2s0014.1